jgi:hypothetical protein
LKKGPIGFPETSVRKYNSTLRKILKEPIFQGISCLRRIYFFDCRWETA